MGFSSGHLMSLTTDRSHELHSLHRTEHQCHQLMAKRPSLPESAPHTTQRPSLPECTSHNPEALPPIECTSHNPEALPESAPHTPDVAVGQSTNDNVDEHTLWSTGVGEESDSAVHLFPSNLGAVDSPQTEHTA